MSTSEQIAVMLNLMPEQERVLILEIVKRFLPDDVATPDDLEAIAAARAAYHKGQCVLLSGLES